MLPYLAQGANSAIEDGAVLGLLLGKIESKRQLPQALKMYERLRKARGETIAKESFKQASVYRTICTRVVIEERGGLIIAV
jgi:salicylate hydroxylase